MATKKKIAQSKRGTKRTAAQRITRSDVQRKSSTKGIQAGEPAFTVMPLRRPTNPPPVYTLTKAQLTSIVGGNYEWHYHEEMPDDALRLACSTMHQAGLELDVLRRLLYDDEVDTSQLDMAFYHLACRLETMAQVAMAKGEVKR